MRIRFLPQQKLAFATAIYWFLLLYIISALFFWYIRLQQQNEQMANYKLMELVADDPSYVHKVEQITGEAGRKRAQYIGEGATFLLIILVGAVFVFRAVRRQFKSALQQQNFMMAITHELKTPIAVAKLNLETLLKHRLDEQKHQKFIQMTLQEINRLNTLTNNILISSQLEGGGYKMEQEELSLSMLANKTVEEFQHRFPAQPFECEIEPDIEISGDPLLLEILISNLLDNATKYASGKKPVALHLFRRQNSIVMEVKDEGAGIPDIEKQKIFQRFYRIGNESVRSTKGTGLGLYLCKKIAEDHHGMIQVVDNQPTGSKFIIQFRQH